MALDNLKENIKKQRALIKEITYYNDYSSSRLSNIPEKRQFEQDLFEKTLESLTKQLEIINSSIPELLNAISITQKLPISKLSPKEQERIRKLVKIDYKSQANKIESITLKKEDRDRFVKELNISSSLIKQLKGRAEKKVVQGGWSFHKTNTYGMISNFFFRNISRRLITKGHFQKLSLSLRKSNSQFIINTYVSIILLTQALSLIISIITGITLLNTGFLGTGAESIVKVLGVIITLQLLTFAVTYFSPRMDVSATARKINQELPFITVHMSAIAGSGIEPSRIFSIIAASGDYPNTRKELIKVINQTNYYGYDLVNALRNVAKTTSSDKLAELFKGLAVTISSGGSLEAFLDKRAETLILDYRLDREKYAQVAENFMNIYIAIVIAAPMIFLLLLILIGISGTGLNYTPLQLTVMITSAVILINVIFLFILNTKQPTY